MATATTPGSGTGRNAIADLHGVSGIALAPASARDADRLADIRVEAMRMSLEALGRFDPVRARARFF